MSLPCIFFFSNYKTEFKTKTISEPPSTEMMFEYPADISLGWRIPNPRERTRSVDSRGRG